MAEAFQKGGWETLTIDCDPGSQAEWERDVLTITAEEILQKFGRPDMIWASPPCECFSVVTISKNWIKGEYHPKRAETWLAMAKVQHAIWLIKKLKPRYWAIENPVGMLRKMPFMQPFNRKTLTYCQYGEKNRKPTDLWTNISWDHKQPCNKGAFCHTRVKSGDHKSGIQGMSNAKERGKLPIPLCDEIVGACSK